MLEKYDIEVETAESAEQAIEYLKSHRPDAIFMDHLMPGMDGLQAVRAIKGNPHTAMIPIMMYTSQEGELYVGQARALGAMGVLPKQVRPVDVSKVLYELHLLPDRRDLATPLLAPVELKDGAPVERASAAPGIGAVGASASGTAPGVAPGLGAGSVPVPDWGRRLESTVKDQALDVRRFVAASLDSFAARIVNDLRGSMPADQTPELPPPLLPVEPGWPRVAGLAAAILAVILFAALWLHARDELARSRADLAALSMANAELQRAGRDLSATVKDLTGALAAVPNGAAAGGSGTAAMATRVEQVPYGEIPFDRSRLDALKDVLAKLQAAGFRGVVKITSLSGLYCLTGNAADGYVPAGANLPAAKCDMVGNPFEESLSGQQRQSLAFANLIAGVRQRTGGAITVAIESAGSTRPGTPYPARTESLTAGEWNRAAASNNRVEFAAEPAAEQ